MKTFLVGLTDHNRAMLLWKWLWVWFIFCLLIPMRYTALKLGLGVGAAALWGLTVYLYRSRTWVMAVCSVVAICFLAALIFLASPGHPYSPKALRAQYVRCLLFYKGTPYVWGGGNRLGIDCSGLVQRGLIDAYFLRAVATYNPRLARAGVSLWWHNRSARAIGNGYRGDTLLVATAPDLDHASYSRIKPGDMAVLADGVHVLAYVGNETWIEADPSPMRVVLARAPGNRSHFFNAPIRILRWAAFDHD